MAIPRFMRRMRAALPEMSVNGSPMAWTDPPRAAIEWIDNRASVLNGASKVFDPVQLESFLAVAQTRNFSEAGRRLGLQQSTVS